MLDSIRNSSRSLGVKVIFGAIILVFLFWGVGNFTSGSVSSVARVNGEPISVQDFSQAFRQAFEAERERNPELAGDAGAMLELKRQVLQQMILFALWRQEAERLGLFISPYELLRATSGMSVFQDASGKFDKKRYQSILESQGISPGQFEAGQRRALLAEKMQRYIAESVTASEEEARGYFDFGQEGRRAAYVLFSPEDRLDKAIPDEGAVAAYYSEHQDQFRLEPGLNLTYIPLTPALLAANYAVSEEEIAAFYEKNASSFASPARYKVRHLFLDTAGAPEAERAEASARAEVRMAALLDRLKAGEDFSALAAEFSEDEASRGSGGDIGWLEQGRIALPGVEEALAGLRPGQVSGVIPSSFGLHLFKLEEAEASHQPGLDQVKENIRSTLAREKAEAAFPEVRQAAEDALNLGESFEDLARRFRTEVRRTGLKPELQAMEQAALLSGSRKILQDAVAGSLAPGASATRPAANATAGTAAAETALVLPVPLEIVDGIALVAVEQATPAAIRPLDEVRSEILKILQRRMALNLAHADAVSALPSFTGETAPADFAGRVKLSGPFSRSLPAVPGLGESASLARDLLASANTSWLPTVYDTEQGAVIARMAEVIPVRDEDWARVKDSFIPQFQRFKTYEVLAAFLRNLETRADIVQPEGVLEQLSFR
ncbi:MAG: SurA N-terminal domain-containing protein [Desulfovibrio sp.]|jgi:peptidyl-prolyl cis-trans isomerase D|nr:SurA N-terminal domain-containing protein [Desulfovibrio sp.]